MYEIFGSEGIVSAKKHANVHQTGVFGPVKGDLNKKRSVSVGSSKKVLGDVSNKVKNVLQPENRSHLRSISPCKSSKKLMFPEDDVTLEKKLEILCVGQSKRQLKSPTKRIPLSPKSGDGIAKCIVTSIKRPISPQNIAPMPLKLNNRYAKIPIFVESDSENEVDIEKDLSDHMDEVFASPNADGNHAYNFSDSEESPQAIHGYCSGYDTPEDDADGWLMEPLWNNKKELERITNIHQSLESVKDLSDNELLAEPNYTLDENLFVDDTCIIPLSCDVPIPDMEW